MAETTILAQAVIDNSIARAKDSHKNQWSDAQLLIFLNKAYDYVHKILIRIGSELVITSAEITMVASTQEYAIATDLEDFWGMSENGVYFAGVGIPLVPITFEDKFRSKAVAVDTAPTAYYMTSTYIGVVNIPNATSVAAYPTLTCRYFKLNTALTLATAMPYRNLFNEPMAAFMDHVALMKTSENTGELTAFYNALEESTIEIAKRRSPI
jgi:hypothetical protein